MDAAQSLADLTEISPHVEAAVMASADGTAVAATLPDGPAAVLAGAAAALLREAGEQAIGVEARLGGGSVVAVRDDGRVVAAVVSEGAVPGLVLHDLRACLRRLAEEPAKPKPKPKRKRTRAPRAGGKADEEA